MWLLHNWPCQVTEHHSTCLKRTNCNINAHAKHHIHKVYLQSAISQFSTWPESVIYIHILELKSWRGGYIEFMCIHFHCSNALEGKEKVSCNHFRHWRLFKSGLHCSSDPLWIECIRRGLDCHAWTCYGEKRVSTGSYFNMVLQVIRLVWEICIGLNCNSVNGSLSMIAIAWSCENYLHPRWWCWWQEEQEYQKSFLLYCIYPWQYQKIWNHVNK